MDYLSSLVAEQPFVITVVVAYSYTTKDSVTEGFMRIMNAIIVVEDSITNKFLTLHRNYSDRKLDSIIINHINYLVNRTIATTVADCTVISCVAIKTATVVITIVVDSIVISRDSMNMLVVTITDLAIVAA